MDANPLAPSSSPRATFGLMIGVGLANNCFNAAASSESILDDPLAQEQTASIFRWPAELSASRIFPSAISRDMDQGFLDGAAAGMEVILSTLAQMHALLARP